MIIYRNLNKAMLDYEKTLKQLNIIKGISTDGDIVFELNKENCIKKLEDKIEKYNEFAKIILKNDYVDATANT